MAKWYQNLETGEITENHQETAQWYREGYRVGIFRAGYKKPVLTWEF